MNRNKTGIAIAVAALCAACPAVLADTTSQTTDATANAAPNDVIEVKGIGASRAKALATKRNAEGVEEVISAEDIGKMPDKNLADAIERLPGVNISKSSAGEGGFAENDHVSIRGTSPSLTYTTINGHAVATADWFIQSQTNTVGRSVSFSLLPSEIADTVVVHKSAQADLIEGGTAGTVDIVTRTPLRAKQQFSATGEVQDFYNQMTRTHDGNASGFVNWKNEANTFGILAEAFDQNRHDRRDGQEFLGWSTIGKQNQDGSLAYPAESSILAAYPKLQGVLVPNAINYTLLRHEEHKKGGMLDIEAKPSDSWRIDLNGFYSHLEHPSYDTSFYANPFSLVTNGVVPTSYTVADNVLTSASFPANTVGGAPGQVDKIYRPNAGSQTYYVDLNSSYRPTDHLEISGKLDTTSAYGKTDGDLGYETQWTVGGLNYAMHGLGIASVTWPGFDTSNFASSNVFEDYAWHSVVKTTDKENSGQLDARYTLDDGTWNAVKGGVRFAEHTRQVHWPADDANCAGSPAGLAGASTGCSLNIKPAWTPGTVYPGNFMSGLNPPSDFTNQLYQIDPGAIQAWENQYNPANPQWEQTASEYRVRERTSAAYLMAELGGLKWRGNIGMRVVRTDEQVNWNAVQYDASGNPLLNTTTGLPVTTPSSATQRYTDVLPSASFKFDLSRDLVGRLSAARTMTRPDYTALSPTIIQDDQAIAGTQGNPYLKPIRSNNLDASLEWYFAPRSLLSVTAFYMDMPSFVSYKVQSINLHNYSYGTTDAYQVAQPINVAAHDEGIEVGYQQPLPMGFGFNSNFTLANGHDANNQPLAGSSKFTGNLEAYYENSRFSARVAYTYRSHYLEGAVNGVPEYDTGTASLDASINYKLTDHVTLTLDGLNLNDPILREYGYSRNMPEGIYRNGRQFFFGLRAEM